MPAEWSPHEATWIGWPHNRNDWPGKMGAVRWAYGELVRKLIESGETVRILVPDARRRDEARAALLRAGADPAKTEFYLLPTDRSWTRDCLPAFVSREGGDAPVAQVNFRFNAWAKYKNWRLDAKIPAFLEKKLGLPAFDPRWNGGPVVLEGGAIDANGRGDLLTTEECLLDPVVQVRNPRMGREDYETIFHEQLGASNVVWLNRGIAGDDTHGHVDDLCRFVGPSRAVLCTERNERDENCRPLRENYERLQSAVLSNGSKLEVAPLPMPAPLRFEGRRLPASYANFYIANEAVLVPTFNDPNDRIALGVLSECFPDRRVVGIHAVDLVWGFGTLHCLTHEQPAANS